MAKGKKQEGQKRGPGRPAKLAGTWTRSTVILEYRQIAALDHLSADIRGKAGPAVNRAELIRAMIDAVLASGIDLTGAASLEEVRAILLHRLKTGKSS